MVVLPVDAPAAAVDDPAVTHLLEDRGIAVVRNGATMAVQPTDQTLSPSLSVQTLGSEILVTATGEFDLASSPVVAATFAEAVTESCRRVVVDVSGVTFLDVAGLRALRAEPVLGDRAVEVCFRAPSGPVRRVLELVDMCTLIETPPAGLNGHGRRRCTATKPVVAEGD
jgi:anti-anti-sigma factor